MIKIGKKQNFLKELLVSWLAVFSFLIPLCFCFYTYDSAQIKITLFYIASCGAFFIWLSELIYEKQSFLTKKNFYSFLPLIIYGLYLVFSYFLKPYRLARMDSFARELFYMALFVPVCFEFEEEDFKKILKYLFASAWVVFGYGILQIFNLDFLPWKNFFGKRVFATLANPNFLGSFAVFISVLAFFCSFINHKKSLIFLFFLALLNLIFTESKGAWLAFGFTLILGSLTFIYFFAEYKRNSKKLFFVVLITVVLTVVFAFCSGAKRMQSVSFRLSTWRATWDMVQASPLTGTGIGSFEFIYPAYKRPEIFYMEKLHNMESQHAENYYLEQWATLGLLGFGLFLWVLFYISKQAFFSLKKFAKEDKQKAFLLAGCGLASLSVYIHNFVDVSIYFVSTGFFLILFNAAIFKLSFGPFEKISLEKKEKSSFLFGPVFSLSLLFLGVIFIYIQSVFWKDFPIKSQISFLFFIYAALFVGITFSCLFLLIKIMAKTKSIKVCLLAIIAGCFGLIFWFQFMSNVYFSRATALAERGHFESLNYYTKAILYNPISATLRNFRGLQFLNRFDLLERRDISVGDSKETSNDFKRALKDFTTAQQLAPNIVLLHYNMGSLYLKYAAAQPEEQREQFYLKAEENFNRALLLDPVNENIYFQLANLELERSNFAKAIFWVKEYLKGPKDVKNPEYLKIHKENEKAKKALRDWGYII